MLRGRKCTYKLQLVLHVCGSSVSTVLYLQFQITIGHRALYHLFEKKKKKVNISGPRQSTYITDPVIQGPTVFAE